MRRATFFLLWVMCVCVKSSASEVLGRGAGGLRNRADLVALMEFVLLDFAGILGYSMLFSFGIGGIC